MLHIFVLCAYIIANVSSNVQTQKSIIFSKVTVNFILLPVNGIISPLPPLVAITSSETPEDSEEGNL